MSPMFLVVVFKVPKDGMQGWKYFLANILRVIWLSVQPQPSQAYKLQSQSSTVTTSLVSSSFCILSEPRDHSSGNREEDFTSSLVLSTEIESTLDSNSLDSFHYSLAAAIIGERDSRVIWVNSLNQGMNKNVNQSWMELYMWQRSKKGQCGSFLPG
ncbi:hypothetical protein BDP27DRAFT_1364694 [Rhodocollybia butyracea]|uniref:Uncharacterized protein n=1 Tax=Rhodocollybia butyracea TaxID=206335 RepID=A0A9P5PL39_9AGAR|nr:hypothetical protein BDP27DRAFT_1364694 [Rhodocollybia butyracea]